MAKFAKGEIRMVRLGPVYMSVFPPEPFSDEAWHAFCESACRSVDSQPMLAALSYAPSSAPTAKQRKMLVGEYGKRLQLDKVVRTVLCTDSLVVRGALTATAWLVGGTAKALAFPTKDYRGALLSLREVVDFSVEEALPKLRELIREGGYDLGPS